MVRNAQGYVEHEVQQVLLLDVDRAGEVHVVRLEAVGNERHQQDVAVGPLRRLLGDRADQEVVDVERHVVAVILDGPDRQHDDRLFGDPLFQFRPSVVVVEVGLLFLIRHG